jgi:L-threonylcarbamoyladenylate synthase
MIESNCISDFDRLGNEVKSGKIAVFPTDTVFGVGTVPTSRKGVARLYKIKKRHLEKKVPVLFSGVEEVSKFVEMDERAHSIARKFWPGQVTLVLPVTNKLIPKELLGKEETLAVRVPNHDCCLRLISACGNALIGTSANFSGSRSFTDPDEPSLLEFAKQADYFVRGPCGKSTLPSTILDLSSPSTISIIREGAIPRKTIEDYMSNISSADFSLSATSS